MPSDNELAWIREQFGRCKPWMQAALDKGLGEFTLEDVLIKLESGWAQIWPLDDGVMVTEVNTYPTGQRVLSGWLAGGNLDTIKANEPKIAAWARRAGCDRVSITGRCGWQRAFPGYREAYTVMTKEL